MLDEAAARRAELLKRYGDRTPPPGPKAVKAEPGKGDAAAATGGFDVEKAAASEVNHNEIWGDCECLDEQRRRQGWYSSSRSRNSVCSFAEVYPLRFSCVFVANRAE